jgi:hypothetical protein
VTGIIEITREVPQTTQQWSHVLRRINQAITVQGDQAYVEAVISLADRAGIPVTDVLSLIGDNGRATDQRFLNMITFGNAPSVQSAIPLTASADAVTAEIQVGAHTLHYGGRTISYSSGTVSGLAPSTDYYVYADDAELAGGAVAYQATTNYVNLAASKDRYLIGAIRTPVSSISASISAATQANPCAITTGAPHLLDTADRVTFSGVGGMTQLNTLPATAITVTSPTAFTLNGVDSTGFGAYTSGGTVTRVTSPADGLGGGAGYGYIYDIGIYY